MLLEAKCVYEYASILLNVYITAFTGDTIKASKTACREFESYCPCQRKVRKHVVCGLILFYMALRK